MALKIHVGDQVKVIYLAGALIQQDSCYYPLLHRVGTVVVVSWVLLRRAYDVEFSGIRHSDGTHIFRFFSGELQHTITQEIINVFKDTRG